MVFFYNAGHSTTGEHGSYLPIECPLAGLGAKYVDDTSDLSVEERDSGTIRHCRINAALACNGFNFKYTDRSAAEGGSWSGCRPRRRRPERRGRLSVRPDPAQRAAFGRRTSGEDQS